VTTAGGFSPGRDAELGRHIPAATSDLIIRAAWATIGETSKDGMLAGGCGEPKTNEFTARRCTDRASLDRRLLRRIALPGFALCWLFRLPMLG
jgi:hypothetical protein